MLETYIKDRLKEKDILLMSHIVLGDPDFEGSMEIVDRMVSAGVDLMELQIPFSEPMADGPVILKANSRALERGATVTKCFEFARKVAKKYPIPFLFMSYTNILFRYGFDKFAGDMSDSGLYGAIVPDLPPEEGSSYLASMRQNKLSPIHIFAPTSSDERMKMLADNGSGFVYCVARKGVTGQATHFTKDFDAYLERCRRATNLPLAVGFGIGCRDDVDYLKGKADIAVVGSKTIKVMEENGISAVSDFIRSLTQ